MLLQAPLEVVALANPDSNGSGGVEIHYNINLEEMLLEIPAGPEREKAALVLDRSLGIPHIPTEGYENAGEEVFSALLADVPDEP
jgi:hypothetical protein